MIWLVVLLCVIAVAVLERFWSGYAMDYIRFSGECDTILAEPGQTVSWHSTVENHSRLPIPFVRLELRFPNEMQPPDSDRWFRGHSRTGLQQWHTEERLSILPRRSCTRTISFTPTVRGQFHPGSCRLSVGDLLGFQETAREIPAGKLVVMPRRAQNKPDLEAVGGLLGDISVRRFILEDPILTIGFRDYTGREPMKDVSWTRTAMTGKMQVKQYDHTAEQTVTVLLDTYGGTEAELEAAFRLTRSVCEELEKKKIPFAFRTNGNLTGPVGKLFHLSEGLGQQHLNTILFSLGRADYTCYNSLSDLTRKALDHRKSNESFLLITPHESSEITPHVRQLENASGNRVCVLYGSREVEEV